MTGSPGWYADPDGVPGRQRWWNGADWSDVTQGGAGSPVAAAQPGHPPQTVHPEAGASQPVDLLESGRQRRPRPPWLPGALVVGAVVVVVVVALTVFILRGGTTGVAADPPPPTPAATGTQAPQGTFPPGTVRIIDPDAGISYAYLGEGWREVDFGTRNEMETTHGQFIVTQDSVPGGGQFIAEASSGPLATRFGIGDAASFPTAIEDVAASVRGSYYPEPNQRSDQSSGPVTVDGAPAYLLEFDLRWNVPGYDSTGERVALMLIDSGRDRPALMYISIPNTHAELYGVIAQLVASIAIL